MSLTRLCVLAFLVAFIGGGVVLAMRGCSPKPTKAETAADSVLLTVSDWQDSVAVKDSIIQVRTDEATRLKLVSAKLKRRADSLEADAEALQVIANSYAEVPTNLAPPEENTYLRAALSAQRKAAVQFQSTVYALKEQRTTDSLRLVGADSTIALLQDWRGQDRDRIDGLTRTLSDLRQEQKRKARGKFLGFLPKWTDEALMITGAAVVGYQVGRGAS